MSILLSRLEEALSHRPGGVSATLRPPTDAEVPEPIRELLAWRDGQEPYSPPIWGKFRLMSAQEIIDDRDMLNEMQEGEEWDDPDWWNLEYVPFATDDSGDYLLIDMDNHLGYGHGAIVDYDHSSPMRIILAPDLKSLLEAVIEAAPSAGRKEEQDVLERVCPGYPIIHVLHRGRVDS